MSFLFPSTKLMSLHKNKLNRVSISLLTSLFCSCHCQTFRHPISLSIHRLVRATAHVWKSLQLMCIISSFPNSDFDSFVVVVSHRSSLSSHTYRHIHMHRQYNCVIILWACLCPSWSKNVMQLSVWDLADSVGGTLNWKRKQQDKEKKQKEIEGERSVKRKGKWSYDYRTCFVLLVINFFLPLLLYYYFDCENFFINILQGAWESLE